MANIERMGEIKNFCLYYGYGKEQELANYDLAIVEPKGQTTDSLKYIQEKGTLVLAYCSALEITPTLEFMKFAAENDFLQEQGQRLLNTEYGTYLADLSSKKWVNYQLHQAGKLVINQGYDGLFLDTLGDLEWEILSPATRQKQVLAAVHFLAELRQRLPKAILIQNNGLEKLSLYTKLYLDGLCWENPSVTPASTNWNSNLATYLSQIQREQNVRILVLEEKQGIPTAQRQKAIASKQEFLYYAAPGGYTEGITPLEKK